MTTKHTQNENENRQEFVTRVVNSNNWPLKATEVFDLIDRRSFRCSQKHVTALLHNAYRKGLLHRVKEDNKWAYMPVVADLIDQPYDIKRSPEVPTWVEPAAELLDIVEEPEQEAGNLLTTLAIYHGMKVDQVFRIICDTIFTIDADDFDDGADLLAIFKGWFN